MTCSTSSPGLGVTSSTAVVLDGRATSLPFSPFAFETAVLIDLHLAACRIRGARQASADGGRAPVVASDRDPAATNGAIAAGRDDAVPARSVLGRGGLDCQAENVLLLRVSGLGSQCATTAGLRIEARTSRGGTSPAALVEAIAAV